jgi:transcriptional regulator with XRE-family HTH domain
VEGDLQRVVGTHVRRVRMERGISQEELADALGYHRTYLGGIERGERNLTLRSVERLADRLAVDVRVLLEKSEKSGMS